MSKGTRTSVVAPPVKYGGEPALGACGWQLLPPERFCYSGQQPDAIRRCLMGVASTV